MRCHQKINQGLTKGHIRRGPLKPKDKIIFPFCDPLNFGNSSHLLINSVPYIQKNLEEFWDNLRPKPKGSMGLVDFFWFNIKCSRHIPDNPGSYLKPAFKTLRIQVCPKKGIIPTFLFFRMGLEPSFLFYGGVWILSDVLTNFEFWGLKKKR